MIIEDLIMGLSSIIFLAGLFIQIQKIRKTGDTSSISYFLAGGNTLALFLYCICSYSLELYFSAITLTVQFFMWGVVFWLKYKYEKLDNPKT
jgi:uncharacterized protein with PQ loop repeat